MVHSTRVDVVVSQLTTEPALVLRVWVLHRCNAFGMQQTMHQGLQEGEERNAVEILLGLPRDGSDKRRAEGEEGVGCKEPLATDKGDARWERDDAICSAGLSKRDFFFFIFKKIKISKIYVHFEKFQKYPPVAPHRATGPKCNLVL